ncbi:hypothetical protein V2J09_002623 [Rumex salicifolius]
MTLSMNWPFEASPASVLSGLVTAWKSEREMKVCTQWKSTSFESWSELREFKAPDFIPEKALLRGANMVSPWLLFGLLRSVSRRFTTSVCFINATNLLYSFPFWRILVMLGGFGFTGGVGAGDGDAIGGFGCAVAVVNWRRRRHKRMEIGVIRSTVESVNGIELRNKGHILGN